MYARHFLPALLAGVVSMAGLVAGPAQAKVTPMQKLLRLEAAGTLEVTPEGKVANVRVEEGIEPVLSKALANSLGRLGFEPVLVDGKAVRAMTGFHVVLHGRKEAEDFSVAIDSIDFRTPKGMQAEKVDGANIEITGRQMNPPVYPRDEQRGGRMGLVKLAILVSPDGRAAKVEAVDSFLYDMNVREGQGEVSLRHLEQSAIAAAKRWTFTVPANAAELGPRELTVATDVLYTFVSGEELEKHGQWLAVHKAPKREISWLPPEQSRELTDTALAAGQVSNGSSRFQLAAPVGGTPVF